MFRVIAWTLGILNILSGVACLFVGVVSGSLPVFLVGIGAFGTGLATIYGEIKG